jgi:uncharacterized protein YbjT (DUF2867 family)
MKIVLIGGGLIGSKLVAHLREDGNEAIPASLDTGVDTLTGEGLGQALAGADVVIDVSSPPPLEDEAVLEFFATSTRNLLAAEAAAGVGHHVALSAVGIERLQRSGYFRAKTAQEKLIEDAAVPYSIVHATQFFEYLPSLAEAATDGGTARFAAVLFQPIAEDDAVQAIGTIPAGPPLNGKVEVAGPEQFRMDEFFRNALAGRNDPRTVVTDSRAGFFGAELAEGTLLPGADAVLGEIRYRDWPGQATAGGNANLHELDRYVRTELILAETSQPEEEAVALPIDQWLFDPEDAPRYEASLHSLLGAVEVLEEREGPQTEVQ